MFGFGKRTGCSMFAPWNQTNFRGGPNCKLGQRDGELFPKCKIGSDSCLLQKTTKECCNAVAVVVVSPQRGYLLIHRFCSADRFSRYIESPGYLCALQYSTTLFPSVSTNALGMFSGAKYAHRTFRPIIKKHHYISATANKYPCKKSFINIYIRNPTDIKSYTYCIKIVSSLTRSPS